jgi:hypothetical protein
MPFRVADSSKIKTCSFEATYPRKNRKSSVRSTLTLILNSHSETPLRLMLPFDRENLRFLT